MDFRRFWRHVAMTPWQARKAFPPAAMEAIGRAVAENTGVLVYLLLADHDVEIVADRGISVKVAQAEWQAICATMQEAFRAGRFEAGAIAGVHAIADLLEKHFPAGAANPNELPDRPLLI